MKSSAAPYRHILMKTANIYWFVFMYFDIIEKITVHISLYFQHRRFKRTRFVKPSQRVGLLVSPLNIMYEERLECLSKLRWRCLKVRKVFELSQRRVQLQSPWHVAVRGKGAGFTRRCLVFLFSSTSPVSSIVFEVKGSSTSAYLCVFGLKMSGGFLNHYVCFVWICIKTVCFPVCGCVQYVTLAVKRMA